MGSLALFALQHTLTRDYSTFSSGYAVLISIQSLSSLLAGLFLIISFYSLIRKKKYSKITDILGNCIIMIGTIVFIFLMSNYGWIYIDSILLLIYIFIVPPVYFLLLYIIYYNRLETLNRS
jgi:hypothetical protein